MKKTLPGVLFLRAGLKAFQPLILSDAAVFRFNNSVAAFLHQCCYSILIFDRHIMFPRMTAS